MSSRQFIRLVTEVPGPKSRAELARATQFLPRNLTPAHPVVVERAQGTELTDIDGNTFLDLTGGIGVLNLGHRHPAVEQAVSEQILRFWHTDFSVVPYKGYWDLAERLAARFPGGGPARVMFFNSGAEAVENAVKIARLATGRPAVAAFDRGFHGRTYMALSLTSRAQPYKTGMGPWAPEVYRLPYPYPYRCPWATRRPHRCDQQCYARIEEALRMQVDPAEVAAIIVEPVQGEGGFVIPPPDFLPWLEGFCRRHGILLIVDEVQTGFGRTGRLFAVEHGGVRPDLMCLAKSIADGLPLSAVVGRAEVMDVPVPGALGGTFIGNPVAAAAALAVLEVLEDEPILAQAQRQAEWILARLKGFAERWPWIGEARGLGPMMAMEMVQLDDERTPNPEFAQAVVEEARRRGVLLLKAGMKNHVIRFLAPLTTTDAQWQEALAVIEEALQTSSDTLSRTLASGYHGEG